MMMMMLSNDCLCGVIATHGIDRISGKWWLFGECFGFCLYWGPFDRYLRKIPKIISSSS